MKAATEWIADYVKTDGTPVGFDELAQIEKLIHAVQRDTIRHCADHVGSMPSRYKRMAAWDGRFREACTTAFFDLMGMSGDSDPNTAISADEYAEYYNSVMRENE